MSLTRYRMYRLYQPWPQPVLSVSWDPAKGRGRVEGTEALKVQMQPLGQAQAWYGERARRRDLPTYVIWECYLHESGRGENWQEELAAFWRAVEEDVGAPRIFTEPREPTFEEGYTDFLAGRGYAQDPDHPRWWSKSAG